MTLGENILRLRTEGGMSQEDLAARLEVSRQSVSKWETNASVPELDKLMKLSELFHVTLDELVRGEKKPDPPPPEVPQSPPPPPKKESVAQRTAGWLLVILAAVVWLALTAVYQTFLGVLLALPFLLCGAVCLTARRNAGRWCAWALRGYVDFFLRYATGGTWRLIIHTFSYPPDGNAIHLALAWGEVLFVAALLGVTVRRFGGRRVDWTVRRNRYWFWAGTGVFALLVLLDGRVLAAQVGGALAFRLLRTLRDWTQLALLAALAVAVAQGALRKPGRS